MLITDWTWPEKKVFNLGDMSVESSKTEKQGEKRLKKVQYQKLRDKINLNI